MGAILRKLWTDEAYFRDCVKGLTAMLGALAASGMLPTGAQGSATGKVGWTIGWLAIAGSHFIPSRRA